MVLVLCPARFGLSAPLTDSSRENITALSPIRLNQLSAFAFQFQKTRHRTKDGHHNRITLWPKKRDYAKRGQAGWRFIKKIRFCHMLRIKYIHNIDDSLSSSINAIRIDSRYQARAAGKFPCIVTRKKTNLFDIDLLPRGYHPANKAIHKMDARPCIKPHLKTTLNPHKVMSQSYMRSDPARIARPHNIRAAIMGPQARL